jgi:hypothetical protein
MLNGVFSYAINVSAYVTIAYLLLSNRITVGSGVASLGYIEWLLAQCLGNKYSIPEIVENLNRASGSRLGETGLFDCADEITEAHNFYLLR